MTTTLPLRGKALLASSFCSEGTSAQHAAPRSGWVLTSCQGLTRHLARSVSGAVMLHALTDGRHLQSLARDGQVPKTSVACAPSDMLVASGAQDGSVHVWDGYTGSSTGVYQLHEVGPS